MKFHSLLITVSSDDELRVRNGPYIEGLVVSLPQSDEMMVYVRSRQSAFSAERVIHSRPILITSFSPHTVYLQLHMRLGKLPFVQYGNLFVQQMLFRT